MNQEREIFRPYLERKYQQANALTYGEQLKVIETIIAEVKQGIIPISPDQVIRLNSDSPPVVAIRNGQAISLDGRTTTAVNGNARATRKQKQRSILFALLLLSILPLLGVAWWVALRTEDRVAVAPRDLTPLSVTVSPTLAATLAKILVITATPLPQPTFTPIPLSPDSYAVTVGEELPLALNQNPIALSFVGRDFRVHTAELNALWQPKGVEWWPGTDVRKVFAVPYEQAILDNSFSQIGSPLAVRLRTGQSIHYRLDNVQRVNKLAVEYMLSTQPSVAIVLYDEPDTADDNLRWLITAIAEQESGVGDVSAADIPTYQPLENISIGACDQAGASITCTITATAQLDLDALYLTDFAWLDVLAAVPPTQLISSNTTLSATVTAQLIGVVRPNGQPVLAYLDPQGLLYAQPITLTVPVTVDTVQGDSQ